jgi:hypothetical protein
MFSFRLNIVHVLLVILVAPLIINNQSAYLNAQTVYVSVDNEIYDFLDRLSIKQLTKIDDEVKPFSRAYIAERLVEINGKSISLNKVEADELEFYLREYKYEFEKLIHQDTLNSSGKIISRWFLYSYEDSLFSLKLSPIAGYGISSTGSYSGHTRWIGASTFAAYSDWFGLSLNIRDKGEFGENVDKGKYFSPLTGAWYKNAPNGIEYSDLRGGISFNWAWGSISLLKDYMQWGHGKFGQLVLSAKPPSYPHIRFSIKPVDWFRFTYIHGWLNSMVIDSSYTYYSYPGTISEEEEERYIPKYIASNLLTVSPFNWLDVSLGNAIVYGGDLRPEFFIPFMFYKFLDHNTGRGNTNDGNGMMYFDVSVKLPENFQFYSTAFVDVTEVRNILSNDFGNTWIGLTIGGKTVNTLINNLDITLEYTRLNPWVYEHEGEVTTYKHIKYYMGHWLGQNSDQIRMQFNYQFLRGLKFKIYAEYVRKGGLDEIYYAYEGSDEKDFPFLYSPLRNDKRIGLDVTYEYMHDLVLKGTYAYSSVTDEEPTRTQYFLLGEKNSISLTLYYGL